MRVVYWTCSRAERIKIMRYFGLKYMTLNGETAANNIDPAKEAKFQEGQTKGFYTIRNK